LNRGRDAEKATPRGRTGKSGKGAGTSRGVVKEQRIAGGNKKSAQKERYELGKKPPIPLWSNGNSKAFIGTASRRIINRKYAPYQGEKKKGGEGVIQNLGLFMKTAVERRYSLRSPWGAKLVPKEKY